MSPTWHKVVKTDRNTQIEIKFFYSFSRLNKGKENALWPPSWAQAWGPCTLRLRPGSSSLLAQCTEHKGSHSPVGSEIWKCVSPASLCLPSQPWASALLLGGYFSLMWWHHRFLSELKHWGQRQDTLLASSPCTFQWPDPVHVKAHSSSLVQKMQACVGAAQGCMCPHTSEADWAGLGSCTRPARWRWQHGPSLCTREVGSLYPQASFFNSTELNGQIQAY